MSYAPTVNDNSGQILAQGINQGVGALFGGIKEAMQKREEKRKQDEAFAFLRALPDTQGVDDKSLKAGINSMGAGAAWQVTQQMAEQKRGEQKRALDMEIQKTAHQLSQQQLAALGEQAAQQQRNQAALRGAFNPTTGTAQAIQGGADFQNLPSPTAMDAESAMRYMAREGADMPTLQGYGQTVDNLAQAKQRGTPKTQLRPEVLNLEGGVKGVWDGNNFSRINDPKADPKARREFTVGGRAMVQEAGLVFDAITGEIVERAKPLDPVTQTQMATRLSAAQAAAKVPQGFLEGKADYQKRVSEDRMKANQAALILGYQLPYPDAMPPKAGKGAPSPAAERFQIVAEPSK